MKENQDLAQEMAGIAFPGTAGFIARKPGAFTATKKFIQHVQDNINIPDNESAAAADWILNFAERYASQYARPVFDMDGSGPQCSVCSMIWPLCGHHFMTLENLTESETSE